MLPRLIFDRGVMESSWPEWVNVARRTFTITRETERKSRRSTLKRERLWVARAKIATRPVSRLTGIGV